MRCNHRSASLVAAAMGALLLAPIQPPIASAAPRAIATNTPLTVTTSALSVFASDTYTTTVSPGALGTSVVNGRAKVFYVKNGSSSGLSRFTITLTLPVGTAIANFRRCDLNINFIANDLCESGSYSPVSIAANASTTLVLNIPAGSFYAFQIRQNKNTTMTVNISVNTAHITTSTTANS